MKAFRFRLEAALGWRGAELRLEEQALEKALACAAQAASEAAAVEAEIARAGRELLEAESRTGAELAAHARWREALVQLGGEMAARRAEAERAAAAQRLRVMEARRRVRLLERLRERRLAQWRYEAGRELEAFAGDAHAARLRRE
ncbi:MAG: hypothetical protein ACE15B_04000 [Bryobacteraceae bacterium]